ncbi:hypothetical protein [Devosia sp.]|uniref:hypothetical protein n=1 Tax=Devosia sp. TaxID=1871048 RepID=UPI0035ADD7A8
MRSAPVPFELMAARSMQRRGALEAGIPLRLPPFERPFLDVDMPDDTAEADSGVAAEGPAWGSEDDEAR